MGVRVIRQVEARYDVGGQRDTLLYLILDLVLFEAHFHVARATSRSRSRGIIRVSRVCIRIYSVLSGR